MRVIVFLLMSYAGFAQPVVKKLDKIDFKYSGKIINAVTWKDQSGEHIVFTTETKGDGEAAVYAYHYLNNTQRWRVYDYIKDCPVDFKAKFIKNSFAVTDLDKNGRPEIWLLYTTVCHIDVSP